MQIRFERIRKKFFENTITKENNKGYFANIEFCDLFGGLDSTDTRKAGAKFPYIEEVCTKIDEKKYKIECFYLTFKKICYTDEEGLTPTEDF